MCIRDSAETVDGVAEGVHDPPEITVADRDGEDLPGPLDRLPLLDAGEVTQDDDTDLVHVQVQRQAQGPVLELEEFVGHGRGQALHVRDTVTGIGDPTHLFAGGGVGFVGLNERVQCVPDLVRACLLYTSRCV